MPVRNTLRRRLTQIGLLAVTTSGMMAVAPLAANASTVSRAPAVVSAAHAANSLRPACGGNFVPCPK